MSVFPDDFEKEQHKVVPGATQWRLNNPEGKTIISVVGGGFGLHGDGVKTFEMYDFREEAPSGYLSVEDINTWLSEHPL